jgi:hypothetical protein
MGDKYDLTQKSIDELSEDSSAAASGDFYVRYDASAKEFKKIDATDPLATLGTAATAAEIDAVADLSARIVNTTANLTLTQALHAEKTVTVNKADGAEIVLPAASGSGARYKVVIGTAISSNSTTIKVANTSDAFVGSARGVDDDAEGATGYQWNAETGDDTVTLNGAATGGEAGDYFIFEDIATNVFLVEGSITQSGGSEATPFSATVNP